MLTVNTRGQGLYEFTEDANRWLRETDIKTGLLTALVRHTSASLTIQENADPAVRRDLETYFSKIVPENAPWVTHTQEGPDDMPAHIRTALTDVSLGIPVTGGHLALGTWQGLYLFEHRHRGHTRQVVLHVVGD